MIFKHKIGVKNLSIRAATHKVTLFMIASTVAPTGGSLTKSMSIYLPKREIVDQVIS